MSTATTPVTMISVESSNLDAVGFDQTTNTLYVRFKHGGMYKYLDVPPEQFSELMAAQSKGHYISAHVKPIRVCQKVS